MSPRVDIVSIGTLSCNPFWGEKGPVRASHATTSLVRDGDAVILVDPSLPGQVLIPRLAETTGLRPQHIDMVFLTNFRPIHRRGLEAFENAAWYLGEQERTVLMKQLSAVVEAGSSDPDIADEDMRAELALLERIQPATDKLSRSVDLFPSYGVTPGACSLLVAGLKTTLVAGDAVLTRDYFESGRVYERAVNVEQAKESFAEILEVADIIVPGHDNLAFR